MEEKDLAGLSFHRKQRAKETISSERLVSARSWVAKCLDTTDFPGSRALWPPTYVGSTPDLTGDLQQNAKNCQKHSQTFSKSQLPNCLHCSLSKLYLLPFGHYILPLPNPRIKLCVSSLLAPNSLPQCSTPRKRTGSWNLKISAWFQGETSTNSRPVTTFKLRRQLPPWRPSSLEKKNMGFSERWHDYHGIFSWKKNDHDDMFGCWYFLYPYPSPRCQKKTPSTPWVSIKSLPNIQFSSNFLQNNFSTPHSWWAPFS